MVSEPAPPTAHSRERAAHESSSLAPSPQTYDGTPRSGSGGPVMNQWTSGPYTPPLLTLVAYWHLDPKSHHQHP